MNVELTLILLAIVAAFVIGFWLSHNIHSVANAAASAVQRATTLPAGDVAAINAKVDGLGTAVANLTASVGASAATAATAAASAADKAAG